MCVDGCSRGSTCVSVFHNDCSFPPEEIFLGSSLNLFMFVCLFIYLGVCAQCGEQRTT